MAGKRQNHTREKEEKDDGVSGHCSQLQVHKFTLMLCPSLLSHFHGQTFKSFF
jgi:hypothetical protein